MLPWCFVLLESNNEILDLLVYLERPQGYFIGVRDDRRTSCWAMKSGHTFNRCV
jgi:hypothetical protein